MKLKLFVVMIILVSLLTSMAILPSSVGASSTSGPINITDNPETGAIAHQEMGPIEPVHYLRHNDK